MRLLQATLQSFVLALAWGTAAAQVPGTKDFQMVQRIDDVLVGVDVISLEVIGRRYVAGTYFLVNLRQPSPVAGHASFVVDCQGPLRIATLSSSMPSGSLARDLPLLPPQRRAGAIDVAQLAFSAVHMLDGTWMVAEFACLTTAQPGRAPQIAKQRLEQGGPPDMQTVYCDLQPDGRADTRRGVEIRFSDSEDAVVVNRQWLSTGYVTDNEVLFGGAAQWVVDRRARQARLIGVDGKVLFTGACDARSGGAAAPR